MQNRGVTAWTVLFGDLTRYLLSASLKTWWIITPNFPLTLLLGVGCNITPGYNLRLSDVYYFRFRQVTLQVAYIFVSVYFNKTWRIDRKILHSLCMRLALTLHVVHSFPARHVSPFIQDGSQNRNSCSSFFFNSSTRQTHEVLPTSWKPALGSYTLHLRLFPLFRLIPDLRASTSSVKFNKS
jgi:hypothetical protein